MTQSTLQSHIDSTETERPSPTTRSALVTSFLLYTAVGGVFLLDTLTPLGFSVSMFYVPVCLASLWLKGWRFAFIMGWLCSGLTIVGLLVSPPGSPAIWSVANRSIGFAALWFALWGGKIFAQRTVELERTKVSLQQGIEQCKQAEQALLTIKEELESRVAWRTAQLQTALVSSAISMST